MIINRSDLIYSSVYKVFTTLVSNQTFLFLLFSQILSLIDPLELGDYLSLNVFRRRRNWSHDLRIDERVS